MRHLSYIYLLLVILSPFVPQQAMAVSIEELSNSIATAPPDRLHSYYIYRSRAYLAMGDEESGLADIAASLQVKPTAEAYLARGEYFQKTNRLDAAIKDYSSALSINSDCLKAYRLRSGAYYDNKEYAQAIIDASHIKLYDEENSFAHNMIEKCYVQSSPKERIVMRSNVAAVMQARKARGSGGSKKRYLPTPTPRPQKVTTAKVNKEKKKCGPRRKS